MSHSIALINSDKHGVVGHKAGCKDIARDEKKQGGDEAWVLSVESKREAFEEYNSDFMEENEDGTFNESNCWDIHWMACADHVPASIHAEAPKVRKARKAIGTTMQMKQGRKWTYIYAADGTLAAEIRNDQAEAILDLLSQIKGA